VWEKADCAGHGVWAAGTSILGGRWATTVGEDLVMDLLRGALALATPAVKAAIELLKVLISFLQLERMSCSVRICKEMHLVNSSKVC
jgi:hypothetical protein